MSETGPPPIDRSYFDLNMGRYYREFALDFGLFLLGFVWLLSAQSTPGWIAAYIVSVIALHRASIFGHDVVHRYNDPRMRPFRLLWDYTVGAVCLFPVVRFYRPHLTHHAPGVFRTAEDPQYPLLRCNPAMAGLVLVIAPLVIPLLCLVQVVAASIAGTAAERAGERLTTRWGLNPANVPPERYHPEVVARSRVYLVLLIALGLALPRALPMLYLVLVSGWLLLALRIPFEHSLDRIFERRTDWRDQMVDSYTIESPLADILQPHGMKYHTAHHLYPTVPYHNLPRLHAALKAADPVYRESVITLRDALRFGAAFRGSAQT